MKQKTGKLTVLTVLLLTVCIAAGALLLPRLLGEAMTLPEAAAPALPGTALWVGMDELPLAISTEKASTDAVNPPQLSAREREKAEKRRCGTCLFCTGEPHRNAVLAGGG